MDDIFKSFRRAQREGAPGASRAQVATAPRARGASMPTEFKGATMENTQCAQLAAALSTIGTPREWITLCGPTGVGKSRVAAVYMLRAVAKRMSSRWVSHRAFIDEVRATYVRVSVQSRASVIAKYATTRVLIIDDVVEQTSAEAVSILEQLIEERHGRGRYTMMTTNLKQGAFMQSIGARAADRVGSGAMVNVTGASYRRKGSR